MRHATQIALAALTLSAGIAPEPASADRSQLRRVTQGVTIKNRLGKKVFTDLGFVDHNGKHVRLRHFFDGKRPVILTLNYYACKTLCNVQLRQFTDGLKGLEWVPGETFRVVTVSINPRETPADARTMRKNFLDHFGKKHVDWTFMVGREQDIKRLANSVGFHYRWDPMYEQYIDVTAIFFVSPTCSLTRFIHGLKYP
ncbi:MAG: SCO family protein, partial [bacterium]